MSGSDPRTRNLFNGGLASLEVLEDLFHVIVVTSRKSPQFGEKRLMSARGDIIRAAQSASACITYREHVPGIAEFSI
jgi:hypothetical protein